MGTIEPHVSLAGLCPVHPIHSLRPCLCCRGGAREPNFAGTTVLFQMNWESAVWFQCEHSLLEQPEAVVPTAPPPLLSEACCIVSQPTSAFLEPVVPSVPLSTQLGRGRGAG